MKKLSIPMTPQLTKQKSLFKKMIYLFKLLLSSKTGTIGFLIVLAVFLIAPLAPILAPYDPTTTHPAQMLQPPFWMEGGSTEHLLGTDQLGRDMLSRILYGTQISLLVGITSVVIAGLIGGMLGLISGYYGGMIDTIIMRFVDAFIAIPSLLITLVILTIVGPSLWTLIIVLGITNWVNHARVVRVEFLSIQERDFIIAAHTIYVN